MPRTLEETTASTVIPPYWQHPGRRRWLFFAAAAGLLATVAPVHLPDSRPWLSTLEDATHALIFGVVAAAARLVLESSRRASAWSPRLRWWLACVISAVLGGVTEILQIPGPRDASLSDFVMDLSGTGMVLSTVWLKGHRRRPFQRWKPGTIGALAALLLSAAVFVDPLVCSAMAYRDRQQRFPVIAQFDARWSTYFLSGTASFARAPLPAVFKLKHGNSALRLDLPAGQWPRLNIIEPHQDWSEHTDLVLDLANPLPTEVPLTVQIQDAQTLGRQFSDEFSVVLTLPPDTRRSFRVPLSRLARSPAGRIADLHSVSRLTLYRDDAPRQASTLYVIRLWLE